MKLVLAALTAGIALAAALLSLDGRYPSALTSEINNTNLLTENAPTIRSTPEPPDLYSPASHTDSNTENEEVALNGNLIAGVPTLLYTKDDKIFPILKQAIDMWNDALSPLRFGSKPEAMPLVLLPEQKSLPSSCKDMPGKRDVHVKVLRRPDTDTDPHGCRPGVNARYTKLPGHMHTPPRQTFQRSSDVNPDAAEIVTATRTPSVSTLVHELGHVLGLKGYKDCDNLRDQGSAHQDPDPESQHFSLMAKSKALCRPIDEGLFTWGTEQPYR